MRVTGIIPNRVKTRQHSASAPMSFAFTVDINEEKAQPTSGEQIHRDGRWESLAQLMLTKRVTKCAVSHA